MDDWTYTVEPVLGDGSCMFQALSTAIGVPKPDVVASIKTYLRANAADSFFATPLNGVPMAQYLEQWEKEGDSYHGGDMELTAFSRAMGVGVFSLMMTTDDEWSYHPTSRVYAQRHSPVSGVLAASSVFLLYTGRHYDLMVRSRQSDAAAGAQLEVQHQFDTKEVQSGVFLPFCRVADRYLRTQHHTPDGDFIDPVRTCFTRDQLVSMHRGWPGPLAPDSVYKAQCVSSPTSSSPPPSSAPSAPRAPPTAPVIHPKTGRDTGMRMSPPAPISSSPSFVPPSVPKQNPKPQGKGNADKFQTQLSKNEQQRVKKMRAATSAIAARKFVAELTVFGRASCPLDCVQRWARERKLTAFERVMQWEPSPTHPTTPDGRPVTRFLALVESQSALQELLAVPRRQLRGDRNRSRPDLGVRRFRPPATRRASAQPNAVSPIGYYVPSVASLSPAVSEQLSQPQPLPQAPSTQRSYADALQHRPPAWYQPYPLHPVQQHQPQRTAAIVTAYAPVPVSAPMPAPVPVPALAPTPQYDMQQSLAHVLAQIQQQLIAQHQQLQQLQASAAIKGF